MQKTGIEYFGDKLYEIIIKCVYAIFIYAVIAYKTEVRTKQSFLGRESSEKAFHRWLKIFETFPEGIALVRNNYVLYANKALKHTLELNDLNEIDDPKNENLKKALMATKLTAHTPQNGKTTKDKNNVTNVWQFLIKNEKGATYELASTASRYDEEKSSTSKFITLN